MKQTVLTVAAHPDDEILGCGGTMARYSEEGNDVHILILAEGLTSRDLTRNRENKAHELTELGKIAQMSSIKIGAKSIELLDFPDNRMDSVDRLDIIKAIERKIEDVKPEVVFTHFGNDLNIDHRITQDAVITACRPYPGQVVKEIYFFEVPSSTEWQFDGGVRFSPNVYFSLTEDQMNKKIESLSIYQSEMRSFPHARSIASVNALAKWRGANIGRNLAEGFVLGRKID
ncbi:PIG-L deacetylase family protein [Leptospira yasudae]